jgi:hypothetical protein
MFGHVAGRQHPSRWMFLSFLFAVAFAVALAWSYTSVGAQRGYSWGFLRFGLVLAVALTATRVGVMSMSILRRRRDRKEADRRDDDADGLADAEEEHRVTYGEIFGTPEPEHGNGGHDEEETSESSLEDADANVEYVDEAEPMEAEIDAIAQDVEAMDADVDGAVDDDAVVEEYVDASLEGDMVGGDDLADIDLGTETDIDTTVDHEEVEADLHAQESLRQMREAFKARAKEAEMRVKQREAEELDQAPSPQ